MKIALWVIVAVIVVAGAVTGAYFIGKDAFSSPTPATAVAAAPADNGLQACKSNDFMANLTNAQDAAGSTYYDVDLMNMGSTSCTMQGYPGVSLISTNGVQVGSPADHDASVTPGLVTVAADQIVQTTIRVPQAANFPDGECKSGATSLKIYLPGDTASLTTSTTIGTWCPGFTVSAVN